MKFLKALLLPATVVALTAGSSFEASAGGAGCATPTSMAACEVATGATFDQALAQARAADRPLLIKVGAEWCTACKAFDSATADAASLQQVVGTGALLYRVDGEKGEGARIAKQYRVSGYPTFLLVNSEGQTLDRWMGFKDGALFSEAMKKATTELLTIDERVARFQKSPTEEQAMRLADLRAGEGLYAEACAYYRRAADLAPNSEKNHAAYALGPMVSGLKQGVFTTADVREHADQVLAARRTTDMEAVKVAYSMAKVAHIAEDQAIFTPYLRNVVERTASSSDPDVVQARAKFLPDYALRIEKDVEKAVRYKRDSMPEKWEESADQLNNFSWWCFENKVNLQEAKTLAEKGVALAASGIQKANVLDTLAEICNLTGDCGDSVEMIKLAIQEAPENEYFKKQLVRFEAALAAQR